MIIGGAIEPYQQQQQQEEENRIYQAYDGLTSSYTKNTYRYAFDHFIKITVKNDNLRVLLDTKQREMFDVVSDPKEMLNVLLKKLQLYNETEAVFKEPRNKLILDFMKVAVENRMMITQIRKDMDLQVGELSRRIEKLEKKRSSPESEKS